jgi:ribosome-binding factor A
MDIRSRRLEESIKIKLSSLLVKGLKDPRLDSFITILGVELSKDGKTVKVIVSIIGSEKEKKRAIEGLRSASGYIKMRIGRELKVKYVPHFIFILDDMTEERVKLVHRLETMEKSDKNEE